MDYRFAKKLIEKCFPEIRVRRYRPFHTGWENLALEVNGTHVFRFPRSEESETRLKTEIRLLSKLQKSLTSPVPNYAFVWDRPPNRHCFGGYRKLQGTTITKRTLDEKSIRIIAKHIIEFLDELHAAKSKVGSVLPTYSKRQWLKSERTQYSRIRKTVFPLLDAGILARSEVFWTNLLTCFGDVDFKPTLIHGDLSADNVLFDPATWRITGVLDWGYAQIGDPALELAHLFLHKREIGEAVLRRYRPSNAEFAKRVQWYVRSEPFFDIMWGVDHKWRKAVRLGLSKLKGSLEEAD